MFLKGVYKVHQTISIEEEETTNLHKNHNIGDMGETPGNGGLKKGAWSPEEDELLISYVQKHGVGSWGSWLGVPVKTGLSRCHRSCRLRWVNYLQPDIKRGNFTDEEDKMIIDLHARLGNKWSKIASYLPLRTDNEIKNYWYAGLKKKLKPQTSSRKKGPSKAGSSSSNYLGLSDIEKLMKRWKRDSPTSSTQPLVTRDLIGNIVESDQINDDSLTPSTQPLITRDLISNIG